MEDLMNTNFSKPQAIKYFLAMNPAVSYENGEFIYDGSTELWVKKPFSIDDGKVVYWFMELGTILNANVNYNINNENLNYNINGGGRHR